MQRKPTSGRLVAAAAVVILHLTSLRRRANRLAIFAAVLTAHLLALHFFPDFRPPPLVREGEPSLPITLFPAMQSRQKRLAVVLPRPQSSTRRQMTAASSMRPKHTYRASANGASAGRTGRPEHPRATRSWVDWEKEADAAVAEQSEQAAEAARWGSAFSRWREHVMPGPAPLAPEFRWDYAATHRIQRTAGRGLIINITDRCFLVFTGLALLPVCRIGEIPIHGDLFAHMDDPKKPGDASVPQ